jgi:hypothetical protein
MTAKILHPFVVPHDLLHKFIEKAVFHIAEEQTTLAG